MTKNWIDLSREVCVVTGAAGGIGQSVATEFYGLGASVVLVDMDEKGIASLAETLRATGDGTVSAMACNVADENAVKQLVSKVKADIGDCSVLVNNAAIMRPGSLTDVSNEDWRKLFDVNFHGYFTMARAFGSAMREKKRGSLIHVTSISGSHPQPYSGAYSTSKAALLMLSRQLAFEWGPDGVRSNAVSPGLIRTPLSEAFYADDDTRNRRTAVVPLRRIAEPKDIADVAVYLASDRASYVTGQDITVDGGFTQSLMSLIPRPGYGQ